MPPPHPNNIRPASTSGGWFVDDKRFYQYSHSLLAELEEVTAEVKSKWPKPLSASIKKEEVTPDLWRLARRRDRLSDSVKIYVALSAESFLNFYGVLRLEQEYFDKYLERLGPVEKLKRLFSLCEGKNLVDTDALVVLVDRIAKRRNRLVHPRTVEVHSPGNVSGLGDKIPGNAREAVADLDAFYTEFGRIDPNVSHHLPSDGDRDS